MSMNKFDLTPKEYKIIYDSVKYYQIHGASFIGGEYRICQEILDKIYYKCQPNQ